VHQTWLGLGRYATQFASPVLAAALLGGRGTNRSTWGRLSAASLLLGPPVARYLSSKPQLNHVAYGAGVWAGCLKQRTIRPLCPRPQWRQFKRR